MIETTLSVLATMIFFHYLADYPLQGDFIARAKNKFASIEGVPWYQAMSAHCFIHAFLVWFITGLWILFVAEFVLHWVTDYYKCKGVLNFNQDQYIHLTSKLLYALVFAFYVL